MPKPAPRSNLTVILPFIKMLNQSPLQPHGFNEPREEYSEAECWPIPPEKGMEEKWASRCKISKMITCSNCKKNQSRDENKAFMINKMEAMMEQLRISGNGPISGASATTKP